MVRKTITTKIIGKQCGISFDDKSSVKDFERSFIQRIVITHSDQVNSITVYYDGSGSGALHEGKLPSRSSTEILLEHGEFITTVTGRSRAGGGVVGHLAFASNRGKKWGPLGTSNDGDPFTWDYYNVPNPVGAQMGLLYFAGSFFNCLGHLQATFAEYPSSCTPSSSTPITEVKYARRGTWEPAPGVPSTLPLFARKLMSPVILLQVGTTPVTFHTNEDILCSLPFFRAALQGGFREATDKIIKMPDDEPDIVGSLLEFLYVGSYTYTIDDGDTGDASPKDIDEALFHVRLHSLACKYDCEALVALERRNVAYVLDGLKGMDVVKVVREMHESGWVVRDWEGSEEMAAVKKRIPGIMKELYGTCGEELDGMWTECPGLSAELLRLMALS